MMAPSSHATVRFAAPTNVAGTVLLIEDDAALARSLMRSMVAEGYQVVHVTSGPAAVEKVMSRSFDVVISDLNLPGASGVDVLNVVRAYDPHAPLVLMTAAPTVETAIEAVNLGVLEYLIKPTSKEQISRVLARATSVHRESKRRSAEVEEARNSVATAETQRPPSAPSMARAAVASQAKGVAAVLDAALNAPAPVSKFTATQRPPAVAPTLRVVERLTASGTCPATKTAYEKALASLSVELEPVVDAKSRKLIGFSARMLSAEATLTSDVALVQAAEKVKRLPELRRKVRDLAVTAFASAPADALLFVDIHPSELVEGDLYSPGPELARIAERVVLQVRAKGLVTTDLSARASVLRFVGFRLAIADLDAGQSIAQISDLSPDFVKIDARLVRGVNESAARRRIVAALISMCKALDAVAVGEGVSTAEERDALVEAGCTIVQGPLMLRHAARISSRRPEDLVSVR